MELQDDVLLDDVVVNDVVVNDEVVKSIDVELTLVLLDDGVATILDTLASIARGAFCTMLAGSLRINVLEVFDDVPFKDPLVDFWAKLLGDLRVGLLEDLGAILTGDFVL